LQGLDPRRERCLNGRVAPSPPQQRRPSGDLLASVDGELMPVGRAQISVSDEGLLRGDGVFEVVRLYAGRPFALDAHLARMQASAHNLLLELDREAIEDDVRALLASCAGQDALLRMLVTRGGRRIALLEALPQLPERVALGRVAYSPTHVLDGVKSLSYAANMLAGRLARQRGFDDALLVTPQGRVLECPTAAFFWVRDGELLTPPLTDHVLDSITRRLIISVTDAREQATSFEDLDRAQEAFIASSVREVLPVARIEEVELSPPGPRTSATAAAVRERIDAELATAGAAAGG
jgi:branched-chain amino acid aminotransferase